MSEQTPKSARPALSLARTGVFLFLAVLIAMAWVYHPRAGWNVNSRIDLVLAVVEEGTFAIDAFHDSPPTNTMDKAFYQEHFYSDKIFGVSLLALPFYGAARLVAGDMLSYHGAHWVMKFGGAPLPGAALATLFWLLLGKTGTPPKRAVILTLLSVFGTMWFGYGTVFYPYMPGIAAAMGALYLTFFPPAKRLTIWNCLAVGLLLGYSLLCDLLFGLMVLGVGFVWLLRLLDQWGIYGNRAFAEMTGERSNSKQSLILAAAFWAGVIVPLGLFAAYSLSIFGSLTIPYEYEVLERFRLGMQEGLMGISAPRLDVLYFITIHPYRGIFLWSPIVLAGLIGCILGTRAFGKRMMIAWLGIWCFAAYLLVNAGYYMWWGGWSMGPRHLLPALPFTLLGLGELARPDRLAILKKPAARKSAWWGAIALGVVSIALSLPLSLTDPQVPQGNEDRVLDEATWGKELSVPQIVYLGEFYRGNVTVWPGHRLSGIIGRPEQKAGNLAGILLLLAVTGGLLTAAWYAAPEKLPDTLRKDYPFRTVDGTAAPAPEPLKRTKIKINTQG